MIVPLIFILDDCRTTATWEPEEQLPCPDMCTSKGPEFTGNLYDPKESTHYVACFEGMTVGCIRCPKKSSGERLEFNQEYNECLYDGLYHTEPTIED